MKYNHAHSMRNLVAICAAAALLTIGSVANAAVIDLASTGSSGSVNGAIFSQINPTSTGSGELQSFLRLQHSGVEQGYNSDSYDVDDNKHSCHTYNHSILLDSIPIINFRGSAYREFILDINQESSKPLLSLDELDIYLLPSGAVTSHSSLGNPVYSLGAGGDNWIKLDASLNSGSGSGDMMAYIPNSLFIGSNQYVCLYSRFGDHFASNAGFEEWAVSKGSSPLPTQSVPETSSLLSLFCGIGCIGKMMLKKRK